MARLGKRLENNIFGEDLGEDDRLIGSSTGIYHIEWDAVTSKLFRGGCDLRVGVRPVGLHGNDMVPGKGFPHCGSVDRCPFIELAGNAPIRRKVDENRLARPQQSVEFLLRKRSPRNAIARTARRLRCGECVNFPTRKSLAPKKTMSTIAAIDTTRVLTEESGPQNAP